MNKLSLYPAIILLAVFVFLLPLYAQTDLSAELESYIKNVQQQFNSGGIAVAIVKDGKIVLTKGYGMKRSDPGHRIDEKSKFCIASNTKAFTAIALAMLAEEGKIDLDTPVVKYAPWLRLSDSAAAKNFSVRDLLSHRSGMKYGSGNLLLWPYTTYSRKEIVKRIRCIPLRGKFRETYGYSNLLYVAAGEMIEMVSGLSWERFISERILQKVGMSNSSVSGTKKGKFRPLKDNPAGGIYSTAGDMAKWMVCLLDSGRINGNSRLYSASKARELWTPVTAISINDEEPELQQTQPTLKAYALGFRIQDYRGKRIIGHTGSLNGYVSRIALIPELNLGVAVLAESRTTEVYQSVIHKILDDYLNAPEFNWTEAYKKVKDRTDSALAAEENKIWALRARTANHDLPLVNYAGRYKDDWYGNVTIRIKKKKLEIRFEHSPSLYGTLEHYQNNTFIIRWKQLSSRAAAFITFELDRNKKIKYATFMRILPSEYRALDFQNLLLKPAGIK
ncbi:MAG: serine hydrolase [Bacteroidetes bacterium]|nr:serine hydrolase [Bacteroidota bacterium]